MIFFFNLPDDVQKLFLSWLRLRELGRLWLTSQDGLRLQNLMYHDRTFWRGGLRSENRVADGVKNRQLFLAQPSLRIRHVIFDFQGVAEVIRRYQKKNALTELQKKHLHSSRVQHAIYWGETTLEAVINGTRKDQVKTLDHDQKQAVRRGCFPAEVRYHPLYHLHGFWMVEQFARVLYPGDSIEKLDEEEIKFLVERYPLNKLQVRHMNTERIRQLVKRGELDLQTVLNYTSQDNMALLNRTQQEAIALGCFFEEVSGRKLSQMDIMAARLGQFSRVGTLTSRQWIAKFVGLSAHQKISVESSRHHASEQTQTTRPRAAAFN